MSCLSHFCDNKLKHGFLFLLNSIGICALYVETTCHYLLHSLNVVNKAILLLNNVLKITCLLVTINLSNLFFMVMIHLTWQQLLLF